MYYLADLESLEEKDKKLHLNDYYIFKNGFSKEECLNIIKENQDRLSVSQQDHTNQDKQNKSASIDFDKKNHWIYNKLCDFARESNKNSWDFAINGFCENLEFVQYSGETRDSDAPRVDIGTNFNMSFKQYRKISFWLCLNSPDDYDGGEHLIHNYGSPIYANKDVGTTVFFPSYLLNGVTPVTRGVKYCLRGYIFGPHFK